ncbi:MAG: cupredoxin domain-containing protein [Nanoarchaeota archaeon]
MKNSILLLTIAIMILVIGSFVFANAKDTSITGNVVLENQKVIKGNLQKIILGMKDFNYYPNTIKVKANQPVEITIDETVKGCLRSFAIRDFGVNKYARTAADKIIFTPTRTGTFSFSCSMGMGYGKLIVE